MTTERSNEANATHWRLSATALLVALLAIAGTGTFTYPVAAAWFAQYNQSKLVDSYSQTVDSGTDPSASEELRLAEEYNKALSSGAILVADERKPQGSGTSSDSALDYWSMLSAVPSGVMARIKIPTIDLDLPIYHGTDDATLNRGVGHLEGTSLPVGGTGTHAVLTAHRGLATATMFTNLDKVDVGDVFTIEVFGRILAYQVYETRVVDPDETEALRQLPGKDIVTLVTCTPLGINTQRILVTGERITPTPPEALSDAGQESQVPRFPWWVVWLAAVVLAGIWYVWRAGRPSERSTPVAPHREPPGDPHDSGEHLGSH